jgi:hypothetical protein
MDVDNNGYLTSKEFENFFAGDEDFVGLNYADIIQLWNGPDTTDRVSVEDFVQGLSPYTTTPKMSGLYGGYDRYTSKYRRWQDEDQKTIQTRAW